MRKPSLVGVLILGLHDAMVFTMIRSEGQRQLDTQLKDGQLDTTAGREEVWKRIRQPSPWRPGLDVDWACSDVSILWWFPCPGLSEYEG
ncbi:hypothetical protein M431DRAFT_202754 [Trichoderma harzianum CBS 226.95]|uniref:Uncharacterized protein n=1 Tax=Trichoderma harzianum CBS 226.95 TaxID=983964 RepID=A0A2T4AVE6_TRIHA|nr:hypothetical protein M431DRAFT_202754 [Trichoderma harzianum CBS 226.95]PTB61044.1 hypothetical protein M431DRAFT_202754 [Trichoderma harzianum CBS 226.95]